MSEKEEEMRSERVTGDAECGSGRSGGWMSRLLDETRKQHSQSNSQTSSR